MVKLLLLQVLNFHYFLLLKLDLVFMIPGGVSRRVTNERSLGCKELMFILLRLQGHMTCIIDERVPLIELWRMLLFILVGSRILLARLFVD